MRSVAGRPPSAAADVGRHDGVLSHHVQRQQLQVVAIDPRRRSTADHLARCCRRWQATRWRERWWRRPTRCRRDRRGYICRIKARFADRARPKEARIVQVSAYLTAILNLRRWKTVLGHGQEILITVSIDYRRNRPVWKKQDAKDVWPIIIIIIWQRAISQG